MKEKKGTRIGFVAAVGLVVFLMLVLAGTYYVRLLALERAMRSAMEVGDSATVGKLAEVWPSAAGARDAERRTPLHWAANGGPVELVERLVARGADVNARDKAGWTPLHFAATTGRVRTAELLISHGGEVDARDATESTPLHAAALNGREEIVRLLISKGADVNAKDVAGKTPLSVADKENDSVSKILGEAGAKE